MLLSEKWTEEEKELLRQNYKSMSKEELMELLQNRTWSAIKKIGQEVTKGGGRTTHPKKDYSYRYKTIDEITYKQCIKCNEFHPLDSDHYFKASKYQDGFNNRCKECDGYKFTKTSKKEGYRICRKCNRELPLDYKYFPKMKDEKDFRYVCRECSDHYNGFLKDDYVVREYWSDEDNELFIIRYPYYTNEELIQLFYPNLTNKQLCEKAWMLGINKGESALYRAKELGYIKSSMKLKGRVITEKQRKKQSETMKRLYAEGIYISPWKGRIVSEEEREKTRQRVKGKWAGKNNPRYIKPLKGKENGRWEGGITNLYQFLRENIVEWKSNSMEICKYRCVITGGNFDNIHHLVPFKDIVYEAMESLNLEVRQNVDDYSKDTRELLINKIQRLHIKYGYGVCLSKEIHKLFHDTYNYTNFTKDNFIEFIDRYFKGEFDKQLDDKYKGLNSKNNYEEVVKIISFIM